MRRGLARITAVAVWALVGACDDAAVQLPTDAAYPIRPSAAVPAPRAQPPATPAPDATPAEDPVPEPLPDADADPDVRRASRSYIKRTVQPMLHGAPLAHGVYRALFGPSARTGAPTALVLTRAEQRLAGFALSEGERFALPPLHDGSVLDRVAAVVFRDLDDDPDREVLLLVAYRDEDDPQGSPYFSNVVLDWNATTAQFERLEQIEGEIEAMQTAGEVLAHLRSMGVLATRPAR